MWVVHFTDKNGKATVLSAKAATRTPARRTQEHQPNAELRRGLLRIFGIADFWFGGTVTSPIQTLLTGR